ncbi:MAG: hypothetical protein LRY54_00540 [Alphaproteobacteria bacterium]|nr:hypothetical protein [Alphaproteobacteria bacterium]
MEETVALFSQDETQKAAVIQSLKETLQNETSARYWNRRGLEAEHAQLYKAGLKDYIMDGLANGYVTAPEPPRPAAAPAPDPDTQAIGGALPPPSASGASPGGH